MLLLRNVFCGVGSCRNASGENVSFVPRLCENSGVENKTCMRVLWFVVFRADCPQQLNSRACFSRPSVAQNSFHTASARRRRWQGGRSTSDLCPQQTFALPRIVSRPVAGAELWNQKTSDAARQHRGVRRRDSSSRSFAIAPYCDLDARGRTACRRQSHTNLPRYLLRRPEMAPPHRACSSHRSGTFKVQA